MPPARQSLTILLIESNEALAAALQREIEAGEHVAMVARTRTEAIPLACSSRPDLIVLDPALPDGDGVELVKKILTHRPAPVIMLTPSREAVAAARARGLEIQAFVEKPFTLTQFWQAIEQVLTHHAPSRQVVVDMTRSRKERALHRLLNEAAQLAMQLLNCPEASAFEKVAELAATRAEAFRTKISAAA